MRNFIRQLIRANRPDVSVRINPESGKGVATAGDEKYQVQYDRESGDFIVGNTVIFSGSDGVSEGVKCLGKK